MKRKIFFALMLVLLSSQAAYGMSRIKRIKNRACYWVSRFLEFAEEEGVNDCQFYSQLDGEKEDPVYAKVMRRAMRMYFVKKFLEGGEKGPSLLTQILNEIIDQFLDKLRRAGLFPGKTHWEAAFDSLLERMAPWMNRFCEENGIKGKDKERFVCQFFQLRGWLRDRGVHRNQS